VLRHAARGPRRNSRDLCADGKDLWFALEINAVARTPSGTVPSHPSSPQPSRARIAPYHTIQQYLLCDTENSAGDVSYRSFSDLRAVQTDVRFCCESRHNVQAKRIQQKRAVLDGIAAELRRIIRDRRKCILAAWRRDAPATLAVRRKIDAVCIRYARRSRRSALGKPTGAAHSRRTAYDDHAVVRRLRGSQGVERNRFPGCTKRS
jgi:hypothetical protein